MIQNENKVLYLNIGHFLLLKNMRYYLRVGQIITFNLIKCPFNNIQCKLLQIIFIIYFISIRNLYLPSGSNRSRYHLNYTNVVV